MFFCKDKDIVDIMSGICYFEYVKYILLFVTYVMKCPLDDFCRRTRQGSRGMFPGQKSRASLGGVPVRKDGIFMSEYQLGYFVGAVMGFLLIAAVFVFLTRICKKDCSFKCKFDERQLQTRGTAFKIGFFTLLLENALLLCFYAFLYDDPAQLQRLPLRPTDGIFLQICIAVAVFAGYCIWNDCYFALNERRKSLIALFSASSVLNICLGIRHIIEGDFMVDGVLRTGFFNLSCGIMLLFILLMLLLKRFRRTENEE